MFTFATVSLLCLVGGIFIGWCFFGRDERVRRIEAEAELDNLIESNELWFRTWAGSQIATDSVQVELCHAV